MSVGDLPALRGKIKPTGIDLPNDLTFSEWEHQMQLLTWLYQWTPWALADALAFGERKFGRTYAQAAEITGKSIKTLYNISYLGREFPDRDGLRSSVLDPGHHDVLSGMTDDDKRYWLKEGERLDKESNGHLTVRHFREVVRDGRRQRDIETSGAQVEVVKEPQKCRDCFGSGRCPRCHGSGEEPI